MVVGDLPEATELAIIGAGPGGYVAAIRAAQLGKEVTVISKDELPGGVCLLRGCIPSKALIEASKLYEKIPSLETMGIFVENPRIEVEKLQVWKEQVVQKMGKGVLQLFKQNGIKFIVGEAVFQNNKTLEIRTAEGNQTLQFENCIIATGSRPRPIPNFEFDGERILSSKGALSLKEAPANFLVIGGGYIGLELGGVYARIGSKVTVVEATDQLLPGLDPDLLRPLKKKLKALNVDVHLQTLATGCKVNQSGITVTLKDTEGQEREETYDRALVSVGRMPNTKGFGLENTGVQLDDHGFIQINDRCQTASPAIYAIGDVVGGMMLAHKASREGKIAAANIAGQVDAFDNQVPAIVFTEPEISYVGLSEPDAKKQGIEVDTGMFPFAALGRAQTMNQTDGFVKVVAEKGTGRVLGVQMVGPHVSDLIAEATLGIEMGATIEDFSLTIHSHPTLPEALEEAMEAVTGMSVHRYQRR